MRKAQVSAQNKPSTCGGHAKIQNILPQPSPQIRSFGTVEETFNKVDDDNSCMIIDFSTSKNWIDPKILKDSNSIIVKAIHLRIL